MTAESPRPSANPDAIALARRDVSVMRARLIRVWLGGAVRAVLVSGLAFALAGPRAGGLVVAVTVGAWIVSIVFLTTTVHRFLCPQCGAPFFARGFFRNPFASTCAHCGLRLLG
jgi:hypothetical protein